MDPHTGAAGHRREHDGGELPVENAGRRSGSFFHPFIPVVGLLFLWGEISGRDGGGQFLAAYLIHRVHDLCARAVHSDGMQPVPFRCGGHPIVSHEAVERVTVFSVTLWGRTSRVEQASQDFWRT
jgi:hypothetical protein